MSAQNNTPKLRLWPHLGLVILAILGPTIVFRHIIFYDTFAALTMSQGLPAPPAFPLWQRISYGVLIGGEAIAAIGIALKHGWGVYLYIVAFIMAQTFAFSIGQWGFPSFAVGLTVVILGMNYLHDFK